VSEVRLTEEQKQVVLSENRELLVSAAAGSGKTAVLVERILHLVENKGYSIDRMLVVTYTRAAAAELRERLETRFRKKARENPLFLKQADLAQTAQISTIHSYCQKVVKEHFRFCEIDPQFTIGDDRTRRTLFRQAMEDTLDVLYPLAKQEADVAALLKKFPEKELAPIMETLHGFLISRPGPLEWLRAQASVHWDEHTLDEAPVFQALCQELEVRISGALNLWAKGERLSHRPCFPEKYIRMVEADLVTLNDLLQACQEGFAPLLERIAQTKFVTLATFRPSTSDEEETAEAFKALRNQYKDVVTKMGKMFPVGLKTSIEDMNAMAPALRGLCRAMELLMEHFTALKQDRGALDFNDLEHMTLHALADEEIRRMESQRFDAIFVDEYQDVSAIQEAIVTGLMRPEEEGGKKQFFFYVGDVKQSIYRFRLAEPRLFLSKLNSFSQEEDAPRRKIILNKNFRSRENVLDAVNRTFTRIMDSKVTEIDYDRSAMLYPGREQAMGPVTELHYCQVTASRDSVRWEAELIAQDILRQVGRPPENDPEGEPVRFSDMVILLPVSKGVADQVEATLTAHQIPVYSDAGGNALGGEECISAVQHLLLLDNVRNDLALIAELRSPLFQWTEQELASVRLNKPEREASFYEALCHTAEAYPDSSLGVRCAKALEVLKEERFLYHSMQPSEYLWDFLMRSGMYAHYGAQPGGKMRQANLRMLCLRAGEYFAQHQEGMSGFLESVQEKLGGEETSPTIVNPWENVVRIMTIHKSKGLEFPTVYVMGMGNTLNKRANMKQLKMHGQLGVGLEYRNETRRTKRTTLLQSGIQLCEKNEERSEKARVLYVAMTRPKNRLVMIGSYKAEKNGSESPVENVVGKMLQCKDLTAIAEAKTYLDWLTLALHPEDEYTITEGKNFSTYAPWKTFSEEKIQESSTSFPQKSALWRVFLHIGLTKSELTATDADEKPVDPVEALWQEAVSAPKTREEGDPLSGLPDYVHQPLKLGVTALCKAVEDSSTWQPLNEAEQWEPPEVKRVPLVTRQPRLMSSLPRQPEFIAPVEENLAAMRGTLTHRFLCLLPLDGLHTAVEKDQLAEYIKEELQRMVKENILQPEEAALIHQRRVCAFFESDLGRRMLKSNRVEREWSFNLRIHQPMDTIVQGVIDLCFLEDDQWVLVDFKTDRVETTAELWQRYHLQLDIYGRALAAASPHPVKELCLYSLRLGEGEGRKPGQAM